MLSKKKWGGVRDGAGRPHEHAENVLVEVVDFYGDRDVLYVGPVLDREGHTNGVSIRRAESIAAHHVGEQARSVRILKRFCCVPAEPTVVKVVK